MRKKYFYISLLIGLFFFNYAQAEVYERENGSNWIIGSNETIALISDSKFINNSGVVGGAVFNNGDIGAITDSVFSKNKANTGGAVFVQPASASASNGTLGLIDNVRFLENESAGVGGAVYFSSAENMTVQNSVFDGNIAQKGGAALNVGQAGNDIQITLTDNTFKNNEDLGIGLLRAKGLTGGAIRVASGTLVLEGENIFERNVVRDGSCDLNSGCKGNILTYDDIFMLGENDSFSSIGDAFVEIKGKVVLDGGISQAKGVSSDKNTVTIHEGGLMIANNSTDNPYTQLGVKTLNYGEILIGNEHSLRVTDNLENYNKISNNGEVFIDDGSTLSLYSDISRNGTVTIEKGSFLKVLKNNVKSENKIINHGMVDITEDNSLSITKDFESDGVVSVEKGAELLAEALLTNSGEIYNSGTVRSKDIVNSRTWFNDGIVNSSGTFAMKEDSIVYMAPNAVINSNKLIASGKNNLVLNVDVNDVDNTLHNGVINVKGDVSGTTQVVLKFMNTDEKLSAPEKILSPFVIANSDNKSTNASFAVARIYGEPVVNDWTVLYNAKGTEKGSVWYLGLEDYVTEEPVNPDVPYPTPEPTPVIAPEVIAGAGLHEAAIEQTRSVVRNVRNKVDAGREYCPNCGVYSAEWDGKKLRNVWALAQGETTSIDKPVKMDADIWGIEAGFDIQKDVNNTLGVFASYRKGEYDLNGKASKVRSTTGAEIDIDSWLAGLYYRYDKNLNWLFATVYGGVQQADAKTDDGIAKFDTDGVEFGGSIEAGHTFALSNDLTLDPSLGVYYTQINFDDAKDNVGKEYNWKDVRHLEAELGAKLEKQIDNAKIYVKPSVIQTITSGDSVKVTGLNKLSTYDDGTLGRIELGGRYGFTDALSAYGWVNYTFGSNYDATAFGAGLNYAW